VVLNHYVCSIMEKTKENGKAAQGVADLTDAQVLEFLNADLAQCIALLIAIREEPELTRTIAVYLNGLSKNRLQNSVPLPEAAHTGLD